MGIVGKLQVCHGGSGGRRYGALCLGVFSASIGDILPPPFPTGVAAGVGLAAQRTRTIGVLDPDGTTATPPLHRPASLDFAERIATGNLRPSCMLLVCKFAVHRIVHERGDSRDCFGAIPVFPG